MNPDHTSSNALGESDLSRIRHETPVEHIEYRTELGSTNDLALELCGQTNLVLPMLVLAGTQTAGRGRRTRQWWSSPGALTFSLVVNAEGMNLPPNLWPQVSLTVGLAVCEALEDKLPGQTCQIKWPNDVYVQGKKICGILVENPSLRLGRLVIGIGINVNNSAANAPSELQDTAIAMCDMLNADLPLANVLIQVVGHLVDRLAWVGSRDEELLSFWQKRCLLTNRRVLIDTDGDPVEGLCQGIDDDGALLVHTDSGVQRCLAGTVAVLDD